MQKVQVIGGDVLGLDVEYFAHEKVHVRGFELVGYVLEHLLNAELLLGVGRARFPARLAPFTPLRACFR